MEYMIEKIIQALDKTLSLDENQKAITEYALYNVFVTSSILFGLAIISILLGLVPVAFTTLLSGAAFRWSMGGAHYSRPWRCVIASIAGPTAMAGLASYASRLPLFAARNLLTGIIFLLAVLTGIIVKLHCPAETDDNPLPDRRKPELRRVSYITLILWLALMIYLLRQNHIALVLASCLALARQLISVTPVGYRLFLRIDTMFSVVGSSPERRG